MKFDWKRWGNLILDMICPGECPICNLLAYQEERSYSCMPCLEKVAWIRGVKCKKCGTNMDAFPYEGLICSGCRDLEPSFERGMSMFRLDQLGEKLIHEIKYQGVKGVLNDMPIWLEFVPEFVEYIEGAVLIPVPLHPKKQRKRNFNQSKWIADSLAKAIGGGTWVEDALVRTRMTKTQTRLDLSERRKNVKNAFALRQGNCLDIERRLILVDDVFTTGATLEACAQALLKGGFPKVEVATAGRK